MPWILPDSHIEKDGIQRFIFHQRCGMSYAVRLLVLDRTWCFCFEAFRKKYIEHSETSIDTSFSGTKGTAKGREKKICWGCEEVGKGEERCWFRGSRTAEKSKSWMQNKASGGGIAGDGGVRGGGVDGGWWCGMERVGEWMVQWRLGKLWQSLWMKTRGKDHMLESEGMLSIFLFFFSSVSCIRLSFLSRFHIFLLLLYTFFFFLLRFLHPPPSPFPFPTPPPSSPYPQPLPSPPPSYPLLPPSLHPSLSFLQLFVFLNLLQLGYQILFLPSLSPPLIMCWRLICLSAGRVLRS